MFNALVGSMLGILFLLAMPQRGLAEDPKECEPAREVEMLHARTLDGEILPFEDCDLSSVVCQVKVNRHRESLLSVMEMVSSESSLRTWIIADAKCGTQVTKLMPLVYEMQRKELAAFNQRYPP